MGGRVRRMRRRPKGCRNYAFFRVLNTAKGRALIEAQPDHERAEPHQIRVHLAAAGHPVLGDSLYGPDEGAASKGRQRLALRAFKLAYRDPFTKRTVRIEAPVEEFLKEWGFAEEACQRRGHLASLRRKLDRAVTSFAGYFVQCAD